MDSAAVLSKAVILLLLGATPIGSGYALFYGVVSGVCFGLTITLLGREYKNLL